MNELLNKIAQEAFEDEMQKIAKSKTRPLTKGEVRYAGMSPSRQKLLRESMIKSDSTHMAGLNMPAAARNVRAEKTKQFKNVHKRIGAYLKSKKAGF